ncbi:MAG: hypothetical protein IJF50_00165 [Peptococcaceae bacterium]|nr:hypothetical protein [Peptococcaceae bacterium]MBQ2837856.1 hypothetical protein [Peptococcaceae bacterium]
MLSQIKERPILIVHYAIVLFMCFVFPQLTPIGALTPQGMALVGGFLGAVWGWSMIDMLWPSFVGLFSMAWFLGANQVAAAAFGNVTVVMLMFMFIAMSCITQTGAVTWLIQKLLSLKFFMGRPWVTIGFFFYVAYFIAGFNSVIMAVILIPILGSLFKTLKVEPYSKLSTLVIMGVMYCLLMGQVTFPFMGVSLTLLMTYSAMFQSALDFASYLMFTLPLSLVMILVYMGIMKFVFRVDVSPFADLTEESLGECPPITKDQKKAFIIIILLFGAMICSSISALGPIYTLLNKISLLGLSSLILIISLLMKCEDGRPFVNVAEPTQWSIILITALVMVLSTYMNNPDFGVVATITQMMQPLMGMSPYIFIVCALAIAVVMTHFATNMVLCIVFMPFMVTFAANVGMNPTGIVALLFFSCQMSLATPGGGAPLSAMFYGMDEWVKPGMMSKFGIICILFLFFFDMVLGLGWSNVIF